MNKNEENSAKSSTWAEEQFRKEADELVKRLETDDRFDDFEPPEELFQKLVVEARDEGLLEEENTKHLEDETKSTEENTKENQNTKVVKFFNHRISKKFLGMTAAAVITCFGLFGVSMSTQGGRSYVMDKTNEVLGDEKHTELENSQDRLISDRTEEEARNEIEEKLQVEVPDFLYLPDIAAFFHTKTLFNTLLLFFPRPRRFQPFFTVAIRGIQRAVFLCKFSSDFIVGFFVSHITRFGRSIHGMRIEIKMQLPKRELKRAEL